LGRTQQICKISKVLARVDRDQLFAVFSKRRPKGCQMALEETKLKIGKNKRSWFYTEERVEKWNSSPEVVLDA